MHLFKNPALWRRFIAMVYDLFLILAITMAYGAITLTAFTMITGEQNSDYKPVLNGPGYFLGWLTTVGCFYNYFWIKAGQTVGMKAWRLKVISASGQNISVKQACLRYLVSLFSFFCFGVGYWVCLFRKDKQSLHDIVSQTRTMQYPK